MPTNATSTPERPDCRSTAAIRLCGALLICCVFLPAQAVTLVRCKIDRKIVYSDTDCPDDARSRTRSRSAFGSERASKPIHIRVARPKAVPVMTAKNVRAASTGK